MLINQVVKLKHDNVVGIITKVTPFSKILDIDWEVTFGNQDMITIKWNDGITSEQTIEHLHFFDPETVVDLKSQL